MTVSAHGQTLARIAIYGYMNEKNPPLAPAAAFKRLMEEHVKENWGNPGDRWLEDAMTLPETTKVGGPGFFRVSFAQAPRTGHGIAKIHLPPPLLWRPL